MLVKSVQVKNLLTPRLTHGPESAGGRDLWPRADAGSWEWPGARLPRSGVWPSSGRHRGWAGQCCISGKPFWQPHLSPGLGPQGRGRGRDWFRGHEAQRDEHPRPPFLSWGPSSSPVSSLFWTVFPQLRILRDPKVLPWREHPWGHLTYPGGLCRRRGTRNTPCGLKEANRAVVSCPQKPRGRVRSHLREPTAVLSPQPTEKRRPDSSGLHHDLDSLRSCRKERGPDTGTAALRAEQRTCTHTRSPAREAGDDPLVLCKVQTTRTSVPSGGSHTRVSRRTGWQTGQGGQPSYTARGPGPTQLGRAALLGARPAPRPDLANPPLPPPDEPARDGEAARCPAHLPGGCGENGVPSRGRGCAPQQTGSWWPRRPPR